MPPAPAVAAVRLALRTALQSHPVARSAIVACSGGADSTALAAALAFECARSGRSAGLVTIDHGLQPGSEAQARLVAIMGYELGFDPVHLIRVDVDGPGGPEAAARNARYAALNAVRDAGGSPALILLGHTADDQAETLLLGLGRGSGARSIAGMRPERDGYLRPLLGLRRADTLACCAALGLPVFHDPHNDEARFRRVRLRREAMPLLEDILAGGVAPALARTASQLQDDLDALDELAARALLRASDGPQLVLSALRDEHHAILSRVLKRWAEAGGSNALSAVHVGALVELVRHWHGQGPIPLPGGVAVRRVSGTLTMSTPAHGDDEQPSQISKAPPE